MDADGLEQAFKADCPGIHEDDFDIEDDEKHRNEVEFHAETRLAVAYGEHSTFVGGVFDDAAFAGLPDEDAEKERDPSESAGGDRLHEDGQVVFEHDEIIGGVRGMSTGGKRGFPDGSFGRKAELYQAGRDVLAGRDGEIFFRELLDIGGKTVLREVGVGEVPARPGTCGAEGSAGLDHPGGEMLVVASGVPDESFIGLALQNPSDRRVGEWLLGWGGKIRTKSAVYQKERLRGKRLEPERLRALEGAGIERLRAFARLAEGAHRTGCSKSFRRWREIRAGNYPCHWISIGLHL